LEEEAMRIKLIAPRMTLRPMDSELKRLMSPSIALLVVGALTPAEHEVWIEDENVHPLLLTDRPDLVGITVNVDTSARAYQVADHYRQRNIPVVLGGIHASACPDEAERHADAVCIGQAENLWERLILDAGRGELQSRYESEELPAPAETPIPRWALAKDKPYLYTNVVCASRGCPFRCDFCYNSCHYVQRGCRPRPIDQVVAEIDCLNTRHVMFIDDNLIGSLGWARELLAELEPRKLKWNAAVSANIGRHPEVMDAMADSGCQSLFIGFETINGHALSQARKHQNRVEEYEATIRALHDRGIMINASLVFGFDEDEPAVFSETLEWLIAQRIETMTAHVLTPYPGTMLYEQLQAAGRIVDRDPTHYNTSHVVFEPKGMTRQELREGYLWIYRQFYSWRNIWRRLPEAPSQRKSYLLFNLGYRKFGKLTARLGRWGSMQAIGRLARRLAYGID
jgi:radical SAM superfamily enzyme YgiQ (UPF0313 family)